MDDTNTFIHLQVDEHLGCFHCLAIINTTAMKMCIPGVLWMYVFIPLGYKLRHKIAGLDDYSTLIF